MCLLLFYLSMFRASVFFLYVRNYQIIEILEGSDTGKVFGCHGETEVPVNQYYHIYQIKAIQFQGLHQRGVRLNQFYINLKFFGQGGSDLSMISSLVINLYIGLN